MLPVIDGYRVCNMLKEDEAFRAVPIMILSARDLDGERLDEPLRADRFMAKPFNTEELLDVVTELLGRCAGAK
jgi:twitching motility two-component system response regulator PilG